MYIYSFHRVTVIWHNCFHFHQGYLFFSSLEPWPRRAKQQYFPKRQIPRNIIKMARSASNSVALDLLLPDHHLLQAVLPLILHPLDLPPP